MEPYLSFADLHQIEGVDRVPSHGGVFDSRAIEVQPTLRSIAFIGNTEKETVKANIHCLTLFSLNFLSPPSSPRPSLPNSCMSRYSFEKAYLCPDGNIRRKKIFGSTWSAEFMWAVGEADFSINRSHQEAERAVSQWWGLKG